MPSHAGAAVLSGERAALHLRQRVGGLRLQRREQHRRLLLVNRSSRLLLPAGGGGEPIMSDGHGDRLRSEVGAGGSVRCCRDAVACCGRDEADINSVGPITRPPHESEAPPESPSQSQGQGAGGGEGGGQDKHTHHAIILARIVTRRASNIVLLLYLLPRPLPNHGLSHAYIPDHCLLR